MKIQKISDVNNSYGTCFSGITITASTDSLIKNFGEPERGDFDNKVTREWCLELEDGTPFTIYDWKEYREFEDDEIISWHVGSKAGDRDGIRKIVASLAEVGLN